MTLRQFINAGYALFVEEFQRQGSNLIRAIEATDDAFGIERSPEFAEATVEAQNEASLRQFEALMRGV